ncbi:MULTISPECIES: hypothetical protein [Shewanella]|uniref:hypothetical protein n=1 Tax=Shewanella TaxID=22 RepID=UPI001432030C|nr:MULTISPECIES: hypothetical protein [Shewanella]NJI86306.1 hypothetical protein [Shewanella sp. Iso12]
MSIWNTVRVFLVEAFWPWFKEFAWPILREHLADIIMLLAKALKDKIKSKVDENSEIQVKDFEDKASKAEESAMDSVNKDEIEKFKNEARIWREAAERLKQDNAKLQKDLDEITFKMEKTAIDSLEAMELDIAAEDNKTVLSIDGKKTNLPNIE